MSDVHDFINKREAGVVMYHWKLGGNPLKFLRNRVLTSVDEYAGLQTEIWLRANSYLGIGLMVSSLLLVGIGNVPAFIAWLTWAAWTFIGIAINSINNKIVPLVNTVQTIFAIVVPFLVCLSMGAFLSMGYPAFAVLAVMITVIYQRERLNLWMLASLSALTAGLVLENFVLNEVAHPAWFTPLWIGGISISLLLLGSYVLYCIIDMHSRALDLLSTEQKILKKLAISDPLTGVFNRRHFFELANQICAQAERYRHPFSVIIFDLDNFRDVNNSLGHPTGDYVLREFVRIVQANIRSADILARYGGEEFILLMPETTRAPAVEAAERLRCVISSQPIHERTITASIGVASYVPYSNDSLDQTVERADQALLHAKDTGKNRVVVAGE